MNQVEHLSEDSLDRLARSGSDMARSGEFLHIGTCAMCREKYELLVDYYREKEKLSNLPPDRGVYNLAALLSLPKIIRFHPYAAQPDVSALHLNQHTMVLAAQTAAGEETERFVTEATFASEEANALVRVVRDRQTRTYLLYLLAERSEQCANVLLYIGNADDSMEVIATDERGKATLAPSRPIDWHTASVSVKLPTLVLSISPSFREERQQWSEAYSLQLEEGDESGFLLSITTVVGTVFSHGILVTSGGMSQLCPVVSERLSIPTDLLGQFHVLRLFE